jgi:hypothetical protein
LQAFLRVFGHGDEHGDEFIGFLPKRGSVVMQLFYLPYFFPVSGLRSQVSSFRSVASVRRWAAIEAAEHIVLPN